MTAYVKSILLAGLMIMVTSEAKETSAASRQHATR